MNVLNIFHVLVAIAMVAFILVQRGPGATAGAAFGSGASGTVFGSRGAGSFLSRSTWVLASLFCLISLVMAVVVSRDLAAPETDLGVIGAAPPAEEMIDEPFGEGLDESGAVPSMDDPGSDLPMVDLGESEAGNVQDQVLAPAADDLPAAEGDLPAMDSAPVGEERADGEPETSAEEDPDGNLR